MPQFVARVARLERLGAYEIAWILSKSSLAADFSRFLIPGSLYSDA